MKKQENVLIKTTQNRGDVFWCLVLCNQDKISRVLRIKKNHMFKLKGEKQLKKNYKIKLKKESKKK